MTSQALAESLLVSLADLGPGWTVEEDDEVDTTPSPANGGEWDDGRTDQDDPDDVFFGRFLDCTGVPQNLTIAPEASAMSPSFTFGLSTLQSFAEVYVDPAVVTGHFELFRSDAGVQCMDDAFGTTLTEEFADQDLVVSGSQLVRIDHPDLRGRGFVYDMSIDLDAAGDTATIHIYIVGANEGTAATWLLVSSFDGLDAPALDGFVQILLAKFDAT
jgi:hypothetical protein